MTTNRSRGNYPAHKPPQLARIVTKPRLDLIPMAALIGVARLLEHGLEKHADDNFDVSPREPEEYVAKCLRHLTACQSPAGRYTAESLRARDADSGLPEVDAAISNLLMLRQVLILRGVLPRDPAPADPDLHTYIRGRVRR